MVVYTLFEISLELSSITLPSVAGSCGQVFRAITWVWICYI